MRCTIDASIFVAAARSDEPNYLISKKFLEIVEFSKVYCPTLALAECAAAIARPTGDSSLAEELVSIIVDIPGINFIPLDLPLAYKATQTAINYRLRGADAVYVAVSEMFDAVLKSWDKEMLRRSSNSVTVMTPTQWLNEG